MKKKLCTAALACMMTLALSMPAFAADWVQDETGWWYQNDDGSYPNTGWTWINGKCYYFMPDGYCLTGTQTPDGFTVDESGAWIVDGVVQVQNPEQTGAVQAAGNTVQMDGMTFTVPEGFSQDAGVTDRYVFYYGRETAIVYLSEEMSSELVAGQEAMGGLQKVDFDYAMTSSYGLPTSTNTLQAPTGTWYHCYYADAHSAMDIPGSASVYMRANGTQMQLMLFAGDLSVIDTDSVMINNLK